MKSIDNILEFIEKKNLSYRQFELETGMANGSLNQYRSRNVDISKKNLDKISKRYKNELEKEGYIIVDLKKYGRDGCSIVRAKDLVNDSASMVAEKPSGNKEIESKSGAQQDVIALLAEAFRSQTETLRIQADIMRNIEKNMARADALADAAKNVQRVLGGLEAVADKQTLTTDEILGLLKEIKAQKTVVS